jgi:histidine ammonia-lyase
MGSISARKALRIVDNLEKILGIELFCASQAFDYRKPLKSGVIIDRCHDHVRSKITFVDRDRILATDMNKAIAILRNRELIDIANAIALNENIDLKNEAHELFGIY